MIDFVGTFPSLKNALLVAMATMHFYKAKTGLFMGIFFPSRGPQRTICHQFKIVIGVQGRAN